MVAMLWFKLDFGNCDAAQDLSRSTMESFVPLIISELMGRGVGILGFIDQIGHNT